MTSNNIKVFENLISKDKFMELHMKSNLKPIMVNMGDIKAVRAIEDGCILSLGNGYEDCTVREDYYNVKALLFGTGPTVIEWAMDEEGRKVAEKWIEKWNKTGCTTFSPLGMTDDEWHRVIAGISD